MVGARSRGRLLSPRQRRSLARAGLVALAGLAFLVRLAGVLRGGGLTGVLGHDDAVYFAAAVEFVAGRLPYRDFYMLHPPGIVYLLSPFAAISGVLGDGTGFALARLAFMALGAVNTVLVALVARPGGRLAVACSGILYAVWIVPVAWERTTYLIAPQTTLLLVALLLLTGRRSAQLTPRRVGLVGACIGAAGAIQLWAVIPAAVIFGWLLLALRHTPAKLTRLTAAYVAGGVATVLALLLPFLVASGPAMIRQIVFAQLARVGESGLGRIERLRFLEGLRLSGHLASRVPNAVVVVAFGAVAALVVLVAWRHGATRLWTALAAAQTGFLMITPVFFGHYGGWVAPVAALSMGGTAATVVAALGTSGRRFALGGLTLVLMVLLITGVRPDGSHQPLTPATPDLSSARCVTADVAILLIETDALERDLQGGCPLDPNPTGFVHIVPLERPGAKGRLNMPEFQQEMARYYGGGDAALFLRATKDGLSQATWASIRSQLPVERHVGRVVILLRRGS